MYDIFNFFGQLFTPETYPKKLFSGSETHAIIVINDDINSMQHIVAQFVNILGMSQRQAVEIMMRIHAEGIAIVWTGDITKAVEYLPSLRETGLKSYMTPVS